MTPVAGPRTPRSGRTVAVGVTIVLGTAVAVLLAFPWGTGLTGVWLFAQAFAFRAALTLGLAVLAALLVLLPGRARAGRLAAVGVVVLAVGLQGGVLVDRGYANTVGQPGDLVVLAANTQATATAADLADLVRSTGADVVVLPETSRDVADDVAARVAASGSPMQVLVRRTGASPITSTALLVAARLGEYRIDVVAPSRAATFTAVPVAGEGPVLVAVHSTAPTLRRSMRSWRQTTGWATATCRRTDGVVIAGDFNATLDHPAFARLAPCEDAAEAAGAAALGTWPSPVPRWLAAPIDHVLVDGRTWQVRSFAVLDRLPGSDHRPVVAHLSARH